MNILNFFNFILEKLERIKVPFQYSEDFQKVIKSIDSPISKAFEDLRLSPQDISLLHIGDYSDSVTFTTSFKLSQHFSTDNQVQLNTLVKPLSRFTEIYTKNRTSVGVGRLVKKLFGNTFSDSEVEKFVNQYKSILDSKLTHFEIREGWEIIESYRSNNYTHEAPSSNSLINSCMNDELHLVDFYKYVPVKILVLLNSESHILARALLWETDKGIFMDRVYHAFDLDYYKFIEYAKENKFIYKYENKSGPSTVYVKDSSVTWMPLKVTLKFAIEQYNKDDYTGKLKDIPYMDTFIFGQKNLLTNYEPLDDGYYLLNITDGEPVEIIPEYDVMGRRIASEELENYEWSITQRGWIHLSDGAYVTSESDFLSFDYLKKHGFIKSESDEWIRAKT